MLLAVLISIYGCTWKIWRALKMLELLSAAPRATLTHFSCSPNFPLASITRYTHAKREQIPNFPNQNSPLASTIMFSIDKYMYEENQMIKGKNKTKTKKTIFFWCTFLNDEKTMNPCHSQHDVFFFFVTRKFTSFNLFRSWLCFALCNKYGFYILT